MGTAEVESSNPARTDGEPAGGGPPRSPPTPLVTEDRPVTLAVPHSTSDPSVDLAVARLKEEFSDRPQMVVRVVRDCRRELGGSPIGALPELVERLARYRQSAAVG
jgi:hypothetical protein